MCNASHEVPKNKDRIVVRKNPIRFDPNKGTWGLNVVPESAKAAWGMRAQLSDSGIWWCNDRSSLLGEGDEVKRLAHVLNTTDIRALANDEVKRLIKTGLIHKTPTKPIGLSPEEYRAWAEVAYRDRPDEFVLAEKQGVIIVGNTSGSSGYLYLAAFFKPPELEVVRPCEKCLSPAGHDIQPCEKCSFNLCIKCQVECDECYQIVCKQCSERLPCVNNKKWARGPDWYDPLSEEAENECDNFICTNEDCLEYAEKCEACERSFCADCAGEDLCKECDKKICESCNEKLYRGGDYEVERCEECWSDVHPRCLDDCQECVRREEEADEDDWD
jgi:hypothetical protein